jgi:hypothetical protein
MMKFHGDDDAAITVKGNNSKAKVCYEESVKIANNVPPEFRRKKYAAESKQCQSISLTDLDPRVDFEA